MTPVCLPTCCCLATFPLSGVIHTLFFTVARQHCGHLPFGYNVISFYINIHTFFLFFPLFLFYLLLLVFFVSKFYYYYNFFFRVPGCSEMFRNVPECSMFLVLSTAFSRGRVTVFHGFLPLYGIFQKSNLISFTYF